MRKPWPALGRSATGTVNTVVIETIAVSVIVMIMMMDGDDNNNNNIITTYFTEEITFHVVQIVNTEQLHHCISEKHGCFWYIIVNTLHKVITRIIIIKKGLHLVEPLLPVGVEGLRRASDLSWFRAIALTSFHLIPLSFKIFCTPSFQVCRDFLWFSSPVL
jgi:hypothetical protein